MNKEMIQLQRYLCGNYLKRTEFEEKFERIHKRKFKIETCLNERNQTGGNVVYLRLFSNLAVTNIFDIQPIESEELKLPFVH